MCTSQAEKGSDTQPRERRRQTATRLRRWSEMGGSEARCARQRAGHDTREGEGGSARAGRGAAHLGGMMSVIMMQMKSRVSIPAPQSDSFSYYVGYP